MLAPVTLDMAFKCEVVARVPFALNQIGENGQWKRVAPPPGGWQSVDANDRAHYLTSAQFQADWLNAERSTQAVR